MEATVEILTPTEENKAPAANGPFQILNRFSTRRKINRKKENNAEQTNKRNVTSTCCQIS